MLHFGGRFTSVAAGTEPANVDWAGLEALPVAIAGDIAADNRAIVGGCFARVPVKQPVSAITGVCVPSQLYVLGRTGHDSF